MTTKRDGKTFVEIEIPKDCYGCKFHFPWRSSENTINFFCGLIGRGKVNKHKHPDCPSLEVPLLTDEVPLLTDDEIDAIADVTPVDNNALRRAICKAQIHKVVEYLQERIGK